MTHDHTLNVKLANSKLNKLKSAIKNWTEVILDFSSNLIGNSNDETNFPHVLLLTNTQISKIRKAFANGLLANIKFSKTQLSKIIQSWGLLTYDSLYLMGPLSPLKMMNSILNSYVKELKNTDTKK